MTAEPSACSKKTEGFKREGRLSRLLSEPRLLNPPLVQPPKRLLTEGRGQRSGGPAGPAGPPRQRQLPVPEDGSRSQPLSAPTSAPGRCPAGRLFTYSCPAPRAGDGFVSAEQDGNSIPKRGPLATWHVCHREPGTEADGSPFPPWTSWTRRLSQLFADS